MSGGHSKQPGDDRIYYKHAGRFSVASRLSFRARVSSYRLFMDEFRPKPKTTIVDVGVSTDTSNIEANVLEQFYPHKERLVCAGLGDGSGVEQLYPGVQFRSIQPHARLPFADQEFDIAYSNAVVEHVGSSDQQRAFIAELCRVAARVFVIVPNRLFPIEHHTALPLVHYLPLATFRRLLGNTRLAYWAEEANLNPLFAGQLRALFPPGREATIRYAGLGIGRFKSNLVAIT